MTRPKQTAAFPIEAGDHTDFDQRGLTKRELFAAMAMQGAIAADRELDAAEAAAFGVKSADALLAALEQARHQDKE